MGFIPPAVPPDYSKLIFMLNNSGAQKWNPAIYDILKNLIEAVQQSQTVLGNSIDSAVSSGLTSVSVSPTGALSGNGTPPSPLAVKVDGSTVTINGSNQLVAAVASAGIPLYVSNLFPAGQASINAGIALDGVIAAPGAGFITIPIVGLAHYQSGINAFSTARNISLRYGRGAGGGGGASQNDIMSWGAIISNTANNDRWWWVPVNNQFFDTTVLNGNPPNKSVYLVFSGGNTNGGIDTNLYVKVVYTIIPAL